MDIYCSTDILNTWNVFFFFCQAANNRHGRTQRNTVNAFANLNQPAEHCSFENLVALDKRAKICRKFVLKLYMLFLNELSNDAL